MKTKKLLLMVASFCLLALFAAGFAHAQPPGQATVIYPFGTITENTPEYTWNAVENSTKYLLGVNDSEANPIIGQWYTADEAGCSDGTGNCSVTPATELAYGSYQWAILTSNNDGQGPWSDVIMFTVEEGFNEASIQGTYAFTGMEQGGAPAPLSDSVVQEAAMGIISADGKGNMVGKISWNMYDFLDVVPNSDRLVFHRFPMAGTYTLEADGFGTMTGLIDQDQDGVIDMELPGKLVVTKAKDKMALEFWVISDEPAGSQTIVITHFFKLEQ